MIKVLCAVPAGPKAAVRSMAKRAPAVRAALCAVAMGLAGAAGLSVLGAGPALAQARPTPNAVATVTLPGVGPVQMFTYDAQVVSADPVTRRLVLEGTWGKRWAVIAPPALGDIGLLRNSENLVIRVLPGVVTALGKAHRGTPGEVLAEEVLEAGLPGWPEDFGVRRVTLTTIFVDINRAAGTVTFEGPEGLVRTLKSDNPKVLEDLKQIEPGDLAQITYLEGLAVNAVR